MSMVTITWNRRIVVNAMTWSKMSVPFMLSWPKKNSRPTNIKAHPRWTEESNRLKKSWRHWGWTKGEVSVPVELQKAKHFKTSSKNIEGSKIMWHTFSKIYQESFSKMLHVVSYVLFHQRLMFFFKDTHLVPKFTCHLRQIRTHYILRVQIPFSGTDFHILSSHDLIRFFACEYVQCYVWTKRKNIVKT